MELMVPGGQEFIAAIVGSMAAGEQVDPGTAKTSSHARQTGSRGGIHGTLEAFETSATYILQPGYTR